MSITFPFVGGSRPYLRKLLAGFVVAAIVPTLITVILLYRDYAESMVEEISSANALLVGQIDQAVETMLDDVSRVAGTNYNDSDLKYFSQNHFMADVVRFNRLMAKIENLRDTGKHIDSIYLYFEAFDYLVRTSQNSSTGFHRLTEFDDQYWTELYADGRTSGFYFRRSDHGMYLTALKPVYNSAYRTVGAMVINIRDTRIEDVVRGLKTSKLGSVAVFDAHREVVFFDAEADIVPTDMLSIVDDEFALEGKRTIVRNGEKLVAIWKRSHATGWVVVSLASLESLQSGISVVESFTVFLILVGLALVLIFSAVYGGRLYRPLSQLVSRIGGPVPDDSQANDEFSTIGSARTTVQRAKEGLEQFVRANRDLMRDKLLNNILLGYEYAPDGLTSSLEQIEVDLSGESNLVVLIRRDDAGRSMAALHEGNQLLANIVREFCVERGAKAAVFETNFENIALILNSAGAQWIEDSDLLRSMCDGLRLLIGETMPFTVSVAAGPARPGIGGVHDSYECAKKALDYRVVIGRNATILPSDTGDTDSISIWAEIDENRFAGALIDRRSDTIREMVRTTEERIRNMEGLNREMVLSLFARYITAALNGVQRTNPEVYRRISGIPVLAELMEIESLEDLCNITIDFADSVIETLERYTAEYNGHHHKIRKAEELIKRDFHLPLTLSDVAERVGLNPSYFSSLFKEETGKNLTEYLNILRIERSKELLVESGEPAYVIGERVGFTNSKSFNHFFKRYEGCTPSRYRERFRGAVRG